MWTKSTFGIGQHLAEVGVARGDAEAIADFIQLAPGALADRHDLGLRMRLIDRNELRSRNQVR